MKDNKARLMAVIIATIILSAGLTAAETGTPEYVPGELIVRLEHGILDPGTFDETPIAEVPILTPQFFTTLQQYEVRSVERVFKGIFATPPFRFVTKRGREVQLEDLSQVYLLRMDEGLDMEWVAEQARKLPGVIYAHPNYILHLCTDSPNDPTFPYQWGLDNPSYGWDVNALKAWSVETGRFDVMVAILDSGLESVHNAQEGDEFYRSEPHFGEDWTNSNTMDDEYGHGTHVAGIVAATANNGPGPGGGHGVAGIGGGWYAEKEGLRLAIAKITTESHIPGHRVGPAIEWATEQGCEIINGSLGVDPLSGEWLPYRIAIEDAIKNAFRSDVTLFFSSGNGISPHRVIFPACLAGSDICCAVGAINQQGGRWYKSKYGPELSFVAPGVDIWSTWIAEDEDFPYYKSDNGTSLSSPYAAGVGALLYSADLDAGYNLTDVDCKRIMEHTARDIGPPNYPGGWDEETGWGCVDAWEGLRHFYWPYELEHGTVPNSQLQQQLVAEDIRVDFLGDMSGKISAGTYFGCDKYRLSGNISFTNNFEETPWFWERMLSVPTGYVGESVNPDQDITAGKFQIKSWNLTSTGVDFATYVYFVRYNKIGQPIFEWVPYAPSEVQVAYTALGRNATKTIQSPPGIPSSQYGLDSDLAVDWFHPDVPNAVHISYLDRENEDLRYIIDNFNGFTNSEVVDSDGSVGWFSSIALDYEGKPHIAYYDLTDHIPRHAYKNVSGSWVIEPMWFPEGGVAAVYQTSIAVAEVPGLTVGLVQACGYLYYANPLPAPCDGHDLVYQYRDGSGPYGWSFEAVDVEGDVGDYCCLAVGPDGTPHISYYDGTNTSLKYAVRVGTDDWSTMTVDNSGNVGKHTSIAVDKLGGVHISYYDYTNDALKYAYKAQGGSSWQIETVDPYFGEGTSICIDDDGRPVIVWGGYNTYFCCTKKTASGWEGYIIDSPATTIYGTSVGIDNLGRMVATYYKDDKLYVARRMRWPQESGYGTMMAGNDAGVGEELRPSIPMEPEITAVIPNPTTGAATIRFHIPRTTDVDIAVYDVTGREVASLFSSEQSAGEHELLWEGRDDAGRQVPSGVYFIRMEAGNHQSRKKLTLLR